MNKIILMIGSIILTYFIVLSVTPNYDKFKRNVDRVSYLFGVHFISLGISIGINFFIWGWFI